MSNKKIQLLCVGRDLRGGGAERIQLYLLAHMNRELFEIQLYYMIDEGVLHPLIPADIIPDFGVQAGRGLKLNAIQLLRKLVKSAKHSDMIFAMQEGAPIYLAVLAGRLTGRPVIGWVHTPWMNALSRLDAWHRWLSPLFFSELDRVITVSTDAMTQLMETSARLKGKVVILPNPIPLQLLYSQSKASLPYWAEPIFFKPVIISIGRLTSIKGYDILIQAFARSIAQGIDANLLILGEGEERNTLEMLAVKSGIQDRVFLPGFQENPYSFLIHSEIFVLSSRIEGLPTVILEALASGVPVIASNCASGVREMLNGGQYGILFPPGDIETLSNAIISLERSPERRLELRQSGLKRVLSYDAEHVTHKFEELFTSLSSEKSA